MVNMFLKLLRVTIQLLHIKYTAAIEGHLYIKIIIKDSGYKGNMVSQPSHSYDKNRAASRFAPSQWETALLCNDVSHLLGTNLESAM